MERERLHDGEPSNELNEPLADNTATRTFSKVPRSDSALVNLEGTDWLLTTLLITLDAVLLELYQAEDTKYATFVTWFYRYGKDSSWYTDMVDTLFVIVVAIANVTLLIPAININVRTPSKRSWRRWLFIAWCSLVLVNILTFRQVTDSIQNRINDEDVKSWTAHFWLVIVAAFLTLLLDIRFVTLYGLFTIFVIDGDKAIRTVNGLRQVHLNQERYREHMIQNTRAMNEHTTTRLDVVKAPQLRRFNTNRFLEQVSVGFGKLLTRQNRFTRTRNIQRYDRVIETPSSDQTHLTELLTETWIQRSTAFISSKVRQTYTEVAEIENVFQYSSWIKSAAIFTVLMLIYNCIKTAEIFFNLASSWHNYHALAHQFQNNLENTRNTLGDLERNLTAYSGASYDEDAVTDAINASLPTVLQDVGELQQTIDVFEQTSGSAYDVAGMMLDVALLTTAQLVNITDLKANAAVSAFFYIDSILPILKYTCLIGYPIGTFIGLISLYQVLVQHKRMSIAFEQALTARTNFLLGQGSVEEEDARATLLGIEKKYQIGGAVYFFGILMSTAVVQQHIFGFFVTMMLAVLVDIRNFDVLLDIGGYLLFVYFAVLVMNLVLTHVIGDRLLTREGFKIRHPWLFFLYLFTFSMVHAVLGFLYALWRAVLLLVTTFWVLNRLDVSLFLTGKQLDNGHYSFMSMLLLTRVIRLTNIAQGHFTSQHDRGEITDLTSDTESLLPAQSSNAVSEFRSQELTIAEDREGEETNGNETSSSAILPLHSALSEIQVDEENDSSPPPKQ